MSGSRLNVAALGWAVAAVLLVTTQAVADEAYYSVEINDLKFTEGKLPADHADEQANPRGTWVQPHAVLDGEGEAYIRSLDRNNPMLYAGEPPERLGLAIRVPGERKITGTLFWPKADWNGSVKLRFAIEAVPSDEATTEFARAKESHYLDLLSRGLAGGAWFRHQLRAVRTGTGQTADRSARDVANSAQTGTLEQTFELFSGGRAMSENLQLDRVLPRLSEKDAVVPLDSLKGISVAAIDWKPLVKDMPPATDRLAALVPADQHIVLFPSFSAFAQVGDRLGEQGTVIMRLAQPRTGDPRLMAHYEEQLCLSLRGPGRIVGPQVIGSVALTGSDPYFRSGTDVALVFEAADPAALEKLLLSQVVATASTTPSAKKVEGKIGTLSYSGMRSPNRQISSYVAALDGAVLVTNSLYQIERFAAVANGKSQPITSLDEFTFFRNRYPRDEKDESALLFISDATIRRWCGPRWRIGASRVTRDAAVLAELQAANMDKLVKQPIAAVQLKTDLPLAGGELTLSTDGVQSSLLGNLAFMTPIGELEFDKVTQAEADAYNSWRDGYQSNWRWAFDPIALRLGVSDNRLAADLTVMPLIAGSEYNTFIAIARGAAIAPDAGDRHDAILQLILAINTKSDMLRSGSGLLSQVAPGAKLDPLSWLGQSVSLSIDDDPFWQELAKCKTESERESFVRRNADRVPVALWVEVSSGLRLTGFLAGARAFIEQTTPGMTNWESLEYRGQPYVKIKPTERALPPDPDGQAMDAHLFYVASGSYLLLTPSEAVLKRALDRQIDKEAAAKTTAKTGTAKKGASKSDAAENDSAKKDSAKKDTSKNDVAKKDPAKKATPPWLGKSLALQVDHTLLPVLEKIGGDYFQQWMQTQSWNNLPILNEWHRLYPDQDPVSLHERIWQTRLVCPGGGQYVWNEAWQTMESTVYGHPGEPKAGPDAPPELLRFRFANFGLTFEDQGLRARLTLDRQSPVGKTQKAKP